MERRKHDPRTEIPKPSVYATRMVFVTGDIVIHNGEGHLVASVFNIEIPVRLNGPVGRHYLLHRNDCPRDRFLLIPACELEQPQTFAA